MKGEANLPELEINNGKPNSQRSAPIPWRLAPSQQRLAALQLVLLSLPRVPLLSGVSPCPTLEAPSGVSPCPTLEAPGGVSPGPTLSPCPRAGSARQRATQAVSPGATVLAMVDASRWPI